MARPVPLGWKRWRWLDSHTLRIVAGLLLVSIPSSLILSFVMSNWSAQTSIDQAKTRSEVAAENAAGRIESWVSERQAELREVAFAEVGHVGSPSTALEELGPLQLIPPSQLWKSPILPGWSSRPLGQVRASS